MSQETAKPDQADIVAENTRFKAELATANTTISTHAGQVTALTGERDKARTDLTAANAALATANTELGTARTELTDFNSRVATELAKHGIRPDAVAAEDQAKGKSKLTITEQCRAAKGGAVK